MKVSIIAATPEMERVIASAGRGCYSPRPSDELYESMSDAKVGYMLDVLHDSAFEHGTVTFSIEGISRVASHQLVRHRLASFSQQSGRYVRNGHVSMFDGDMVIPKSVADVCSSETENAASLKDERMLNALYTYEDALNGLIDIMAEYDIPNEDKRYLYPQGMMTNITVTMNVRELYHFFNMRCCQRAQREIRCLAEEMLRLCRLKWPGLFDEAGAQCVTLGYCPEEHPCGRCPTLAELKAKE